MDLEDTWDITKDIIILIIFILIITLTTILIVNNGQDYIIPEVNYYQIINETNYSCQPTITDSTNFKWDFRIQWNIWYYYLFFEIGLIILIFIFQSLMFGYIPTWGHEK